MKTKVFTLVGALLIGMATFAQSSTNEQEKCQFDVQLTKNNEVVVRQTNALGKEIKIRVFNDEGVRVNTQKYTCNGNFKATYNLSNLNDGNFTFEIVCNNTVIYAEQLTKFANGSLSIPQQIPLKDIDQKYEKQNLITNK